MRFWVACVAWVISGCGPKHEASAPAPTPIETGVQVVDEAPDLSPVQRPSEVFVVGRIARPQTLVDTLTRWSSVPLAVDDLIPEEARPLSRVVLWDAPVELLVALDNFGEGKLPPPLVIAAVGLKSLDEALKAAETLQLPTRKIGPGIYRVGDFQDASCALAVSVGKAGARLICGRRTKDVDALLPYATRGLPNEPDIGADLELNLDGTPLQQRYGRDVAALRLLATMGIRELALDSPRFDRALADAVYGLVDESINLFNDLDQIRLEGRIDASANLLRGSAELRLKGDSSWVAGTIAAAKPLPVPESLPRLPPGTTAATYHPPLPAERYAAISRILGELGEGAMEHEKLPAETRRRARHLLDTVLSSQPETFAFAMTPPPADALGYRHSDTVVARVSEPAARMLGIYSDLAQLLSDPAVKGWVKQSVKHKLGDQGERSVNRLWPKVTKKPFKLAGFKAPATLFEVTLDLKAWSAIDDVVARVLEKVLPGEGNELQRFDVIVQPDGAGTYVVTGDDPREMARVVAEQRKTEPGIPFAHSKRDEKVTLAGFLTLAYLAHPIARSVGNDAVLKAVSNAPHHGQTPIAFSSTVGTGTARVDFEVSADVFADISAAALAAGAPLGSAHSN